MDDWIRFGVLPLILLAGTALRYWLERRYFKARCLTAKDDPVLARIWDNEDAAIFDEM